MSSSNKITIRNYYGQILGYIIEDSKGNKLARDFYGRIVAKYDKASNLTRDFYGRIVARGDVTTGLIQNVDLK